MTKPDFEILASLLAKDKDYSDWKISDLKSYYETPNRLFIVQENKGFILIQKAGDEAEIILIYVGKEFRGQGIASEIMGASLKNLIEEHIAKIFLEVAIDNIHAIKLYENFGFKNNGIRKNYYEKNGEKIDAFIMILEVS